MLTIKQEDKDTGADQIIVFVNSRVRLSGWGEWTEWGDCDDEGLQHRTRRCSEDHEAEASLCQGNITQSRLCQPHEVPGKRVLFSKLL